MLRGVVTLTSPDLYIQDSTGGIRVTHSTTPILNVGDVVEVHGRVQPGFGGALIKSDAIRLLWFSTPEPSIAITSFSGRFRYLRRAICRDRRSANSQRGI